MVFSSLLALTGIDAQARKILGITQVPAVWKEPLGLEEICTRDCLNRVKARLTQVITGASPQISVKLRFRQGKGRSLLCQGQMSPVFAEGGRIIAAVLKFTPMALSRGDRSAKTGLAYLARTDHQQIVDCLPQGVFSIDTQWKIRSFNRRAEEMTGLKREDALGKYCWQVFRAGGCRSECPFEKVFQQGVEEEKYQMGVACPDGSFKEFRAVASPLEDEKGALIGGIQTFLSPVNPKGVKARLRTETFHGMVGKSRAMQIIFSRLSDIAKSPSNVLITGESGTGKELVARAIHSLSRVKKGPFQAVNCSALAESLLESELFGHEKGAYTGAERTKPGRFELASGGSLFLDEIGEMDPGLQVKLLRVLDHKEFERVGSNRSLPLKARIVSATHRDLDARQESGEFRTDLFYRLRTIPIHLPPLRERREDIPLLVNFFIEKFNHRYGKAVRMLDPVVMKTFMEHDWPGNVRELERVMENAFVFVKGPIIFPRCLPPKIKAVTPKAAPQTQNTSPEKERIIQALEQAGQKRAQAASLLGMSRSSLWRRMKQYGLLETAPQN